MSESEKTEAVLLGAVDCCEDKCQVRKFQNAK